MNSTGSEPTPDKESGPASSTTTPSDKRKHKPRTLRRIAERKARREEAERAAALEKFGPSAIDERSGGDRRKPKPVDETERILREMGITDRRRMDRRSRGSW